MDLKQRLMPLTMSMRKKLMALFAFMLIIFISTYGIYEMAKSSVTIVVDEMEEITAATHAQTVEELFREQGLQVKDADDVSPDLTSPIENNMSVEWTRAVQVEVMIGDDFDEVWTTARTVEDLTSELEVEVNKHDYISHDLDQTVEEGLALRYEQAFPVSVIVDGQEKELYTTSTTVADFLQEAEVILEEDDRVKPELKEKLTNETEIQVTRVEKITDVVEEEIDFKTVTSKDDSLESGEERVSEKGEKGLLEKKYEVVLEDGEEVSRKLVKEEKVKEKKDRLVTIGSKPSTSGQSNKQTQSAPEQDSSPSPTNSTSSAQSSSGPEHEQDSQEEETVTMEATAYTADCKGCSGKTATGIDLNNNPDKKVVAVDPDVIPLGSEVHVEGYGRAVAGDTGGAIQGNRIDLHVPTTSDATSFGRKTVEVTIID
ncbi:G5 and 3D domain-containing protein [Thalassobacillus sp. C254]|uniref:G5 and 3D domain-containing protein n=1 Tax=Thalassobacillus sp. C254 TaxID=1225341 RepID=UPI0006D0F931|nr:G5 and 3D domain-containing protein [Thalassobacillus sp. C254]